MVHIVATIANDADHLPAFVTQLGDEIPPPPADPEAEIWGLGYYGDGRALIIQKPGSILTHRGFAQLTKNIHSPVIIGTVTQAGEQQPPPYRFRRWLFGPAGSFEALESLRERIVSRWPSFLSTELSVKTGADLAFGMFLAELHRTGHFEDPLFMGQPILDLLLETRRNIEMLIQKSGQPAISAAMVLTNGRELFAVNAGSHLAWRTQNGLEGTQTNAELALNDFRRVAEALKRFRAVVLTDQTNTNAGAWQPIPHHSALWVDRQLEVHQVAPPA